MRKAPHVITFRLDPVHFAMLTELVPKGSSVGAYTRELVLRALHQEKAGAHVATRLEALILDQQTLRSQLDEIVQLLTQTPPPTPSRPVSHPLEKLILG
jgi:hypothetical protein